MIYKGSWPDRPLDRSLDRAADRALAEEYTRIVLLWLSGMCDFVDDSSLSVDDLFVVWTAWCDRFHQMTGTRLMFSSSLKSKMTVRVQRNKTHVVGVRWRE
jgi:hypothetical protein